MTETPDPLLANSYISSPTDRRKYPIDLKGNKNQWQGLIHHQQGINEELIKAETLVKEINQKTLMSEYDRQIVETFQRKQEDLYRQKQEIDETTRKIEDYKKDQNLLQVKRANQQQDLAEDYNEKIRAKYDQNSTDRLKNRIIYNDLCNRYANKELQKDRNYANFYRDVQNQQTNLQELHKEKVLSPQEKRTYFLDTIIEKNIIQKDQKVEATELEKQSKFNRNLSEMAFTNKQKIGVEEYKKTLNSEERRLKDEQRLKELNDYNEFLNLEQQKKKTIQNQYKLDLIRQTQEQKKMKSVSVSMSPLEKRLNYGDLQAFKTYDPSLHSMIPGWSPQIGGMPVEKTLRIKTEPDVKDFKTTGFSLCSPKLVNDYKEKLEKTNEILVQGDKDAVDRNYLSESQLKHLIIYEGQLSNQVPNMKLRSKNDGNNATIFSQAGMNSIK